MENLFNDDCHDRDHLFDQYRMYVDSAERNSERRSHLNAFYITLHSLFISSLSFLKASVLDYAIPLCILGIVLSVIWLLHLINYRGLNKAKYKIIQAIEMQLPLNLYNEEWSIYKTSKKKCNPLRYFSFSRLDMSIPIILLIIYTFIIFFVL